MPRPACFLYGRLLDPVLLEEFAPHASFDRIAHLPAHRLGFSTEGRPVVVADEGHTVWGAVFFIDEDELETAAVAEVSREGTRQATQAVDRDGGRTDVIVFSGLDRGEPQADTVGHMVAGARHWGLPAGWIVGLEDLIDPFEF